MSRKLTAEKIADEFAKLHRGFHMENGRTHLLRKIKKLVSNVCKEQREICANTITLGYFVDDDAEKRGNDHIRNCPEPNQSK